MFVAVSCMLVVMHRCVASRTGWILDTVDTFGDASSARHSHRRVFKSVVGFDYRWEPPSMAGGVIRGSRGEPPLQSAIRSSNDEH